MSREKQIGVHKANWGPVCGGPLHGHPGGGVDVSLLSRLRGAGAPEPALDRAPGRSLSELCLPDSLREGGGHRSSHAASFRRFL